MATSVVEAVIAPHAHTFRRSLATALLFCVIGCSVVAATVMTFYPPESWAFELTISLSLTVSLTMTMTLYIGYKNRQTYLLSLELRRLLDRDRLTDVATRDFFFSRMDAAPGGYGVSLMVDIDHFKAINDTHGHLAGDAVIRQVAAILAANCRIDDIVCRFGGEEFVIFLHEAGPERGSDVAERMRLCVQEARIAPFDVPIGVTVSIGASLKQAAEAIMVSIQQADAALYRAKASGRNRVVLDWRKAHHAEAVPDGRGRVGVGKAAGSAKGVPPRGPPETGQGAGLCAGPGTDAVTLALASPQAEPEAAPGPERRAAKLALETMPRHG